VIPAQAFSFPSGHAMVSMAFYCFLAYVSWRVLRGWQRAAWAAGLLLLVLLVGLSRLYLGVHYLTDVAAGYLAGFIWADAVIHRRGPADAAPTRRGELGGAPSPPWPPRTIRFDLIAGRGTRRTAGGGIVCPGSGGRQAAVRSSSGHGLGDAPGASAVDDAARDGDRGGIGAREAGRRRAAPGLEQARASQLGLPSDLAPCRDHYRCLDPAGGRVCWRITQTHQRQIDADRAGWRSGYLARDRPSTVTGRCRCLEAALRGARSTWRQNAASPISSAMDPASALSWRPSPRAHFRLVWRCRLESPRTGAIRAVGPRLPASTASLAGRPLPWRGTGTLRSIWIVPEREAVQSGPMNGGGCPAHHERLLKRIGSLAAIRAS
jgi:hypothetical protein